MSDIAHRLRAARLAGGYTMMVDAANAMGISTLNYHRLETGVTKLGERAVKAAADAFSVSQAFLETGKASLRNDTLAARLAKIIARLKDVTDLGLDGSVRLRTMRVELGFESARSAALAKGWKVSTFVAHENGSRRLPVDRMIGYALSFGVRPEFAIAGDGDMSPDQRDSASWWVEHRQENASVKPTVSEDLNWRWLDKQRGRQGLGVPVVELVGGKASLLKEKLLVPKGVFPQLESAKASRARIYGVVEHLDSGDKIWLVDPVNPSGAVVSASGEGRIWTVASAPEKYEAIDIVRQVKVGRDVVLGGLVGSLTYQAG